MHVHGAAEERLCADVVGEDLGRTARRMPNGRASLWDARHLELLLEERHCLPEGPEAGSSVRGGTKCDSRLRSECVGFRARGCIAMSGQVVPRERARELVRAEALEEAGRGEVTCL